MYDPNNRSEFLDFEIGGIFDTVKKVGKGAMKAVGKVTDATITKPSAMIGKAIGGKKGEAIGRKLGGFTAKVTNLGVGAGAAGALASPALLGTAGAAIGAKKLLSGKSKKSGKASAKASGKASANFAGNALFGTLKGAGGYSPAAASSSCAKSDDNALAAKVGAMLAKSLGGPLSDANKALKLAELQRTATYEHNKLMADAEFRKKVLAGLAIAAARGNERCMRTIRVLVGR